MSAKLRGQHCPTRPPGHSERGGQAIRIHATLQRPGSLDRGVVTSVCEDMRPPGQVLLPVSFWAWIQLCPDSSAVCGHLLSRLPQADSGFILASLPTPPMPPTDGGLQRGW